MLMESGEPVRRTDLEVSSREEASMPLLLVLFALFAPRIVLILLWLLTEWPHHLFRSILWPLLGLILLPTTLLWYMVVQHWFGGQWSAIPVVGIVIALLIDLSPARGRR
jgi:hypothetical protein